MKGARIEGVLMSEHILVGTDGSKVALSAAEWAALEAEDRGVGVTVVGVYDANAFHRRLVRPKDLAEREAERAVTTTIARMAEVAPVVDAVGEVVEGPSPARELILRSESATLVVIGSYGTGLLHGTRLGTVADQVAAHSRVPVVVVPHVPTETDARDVVVGVDGSPGAEVSVEAALEFTAASGGRVHALWAWSAPEAMVPIGSPEEEQLRRWRRADLDKALRPVLKRHPNADIVHEVVRDPPARALLTGVPRVRLIVVGARGAQGFSPLPLGGVARGVLYHSDIPVMVVHHPDV
ncbi:universal stress family protein [Nocardiopsis alba ATCC BAA-2165]|uniref:Universal stress family protein n=2 Tax=Nocardiopsis alba TaxID=53437 RepID=J7LBQ9_NOCAA|nr:universal stress family protein [Nocardiopsis alba ATCC BAA-2165]